MEAEVSVEASVVAEVEEVGVPEKVEDGVEAEPDSGNQWRQL